MRLATAMPLGSHVALGDLDLSSLLAGMRRGADGNYVSCRVAERAQARTSSGSETAARLTDGAVDSRWESAPVAVNTTAWAAIDLGSEQALQEVEVVWHLQHPRRYEVQTSLDGVAWVTRAVQVSACNPMRPRCSPVRSRLQPHASRLRPHACR